MPERNLTLNCLMALFNDGAFSNKLINDTLRENDLTPVQRSFFTRLFMGVVDRVLLLDGIINNISSVPVKKLRPVILNILRMSLYQLLFMDQVPDHAVLSTAQKLCEKRKMHSLKGFVNGVLRNASKNRDSLIENTLAGLSGEEGQALLLSLPLPLYSYLRESMGEEALLGFVNSSEAVKGVTLRVNENKISYGDGVALVKTENKLNIELINEYKALKIWGFNNLLEVPGFKEGAFYVQDLSSMEAVYEAGIRPGERILDICAAPGGKGLLAASLTGEKGHVVMRDLSEEKVRRMEENAKRLGVENVTLQCHDAGVRDESLLEGFDLCLCDLPCSGLGTIHKKPEIKYRMTMEGVRQLSDLQFKILLTAADYVRRKGRLMFSTCTLGSLENTGNVERFLRERNDFIKIKEKQIIPRNGDGRDGFYYCLMEKREND